MKYKKGDKVIVIKNSNLNYNSLDPERSLFNIGDVGTILSFNKAFNTVYIEFNFEGDKVSIWYANLDQIIPYTPATRILFGSSNE